MKTGSDTVWFWIPYPRKQAARLTRDRQRNNANNSLSPRLYSTPSFFFFFPPLAEERANESLHFYRKPADSPRDTSEADLYGLIISTTTNKAMILTKVIASYFY